MKKKLKFEIYKLIYSALCSLYQNLKNDFYIAVLKLHPYLNIHNLTKKIQNKNILLDIQGNHL